MKMYLNYNNIYKSGIYGVMPAEIYDEVELILPDGFSEVEMANGSKGIEWPDGQISLDTEVCTEHRGATAIPYIVDCSGSNPRNLYLKAEKI